MTGPGDRSTGATPVRLHTSKERSRPEHNANEARKIRRDLVDLPGGVFAMGSEDPDAHPADGEGPVRTVEVEPFLIGSTTVTNAQYERFVKSTGYRTQAEEFGWSFVFHLFVRDIDPRMVRGVAAGTPWWVGIDGADWRHPEGPGSSLKDRRDHPVVHVSWHDAQSYCAWSGTRLPDEAEWEYAARGGLLRRRYAWGDELTPGGRHMCNIWQGDFPRHNTADDGYVGTAPARSFPANGYGLFNVAGNVWEWTVSPWAQSPGRSTPDVWTIRGGSYLCHDSYCNRYRVAARTLNAGDSSSGNTGFRIAADAR
ncbi:formylglycine-generating enzyme family protein [Pseudactinotalea sp. Z1732]|uniref:formylglycine-generating enzyme family protein n=1 Tax=Pseudactinotalea sp. Z1732 TaxID=3413026 RepID=UPI003C7DBA74